jgi:L-cysteine:1D-myo-inositol 2-amino-2-deoxy-alpha-D-glucopyranoside ligase
MTYDLLQRRLEDLGYEVHMVRNITDVDDPLFAKAKELNTDYISLAEAEIASFQETLNKLNFRPAFAEPKASDYIFKIAGAIKTLIDNHYTYYIDQDIYFNTSRYPNFGKFSGYSDKLLHTLMAERGGNPYLKSKRQALDFLLWKHTSDPKDKAQWTTVIGNGRPGWHIECSVMSADILGNTFDIHGGGADLIFPHHESEIVQNVALHGSQLARHWLHVAPLFMAGEKMSKSLGNMIFAKDLLRKYEPSTIRLALMYYHHRTGGEWQSELLIEAERLLHSLHKAGSQCDDIAATKLLSEVRVALDDDINTVKVIEALRAFTNQAPKHQHNQSSLNPIVSKTLELLALI